MINHIWQSTVFAIAAGLLTLAFRRNRAQVRYWLWFSASLKFFVPLVLLISLGSHVRWTPAAREIAAPSVLAIEQVTEPFPQTVSFSPTTIAPTHDWIPIALLIAWACGFWAIVLIRFRGWLRIRAAVRASVPLDITAPVEIRSSPGLLEPGVVGLLRPILLVPAGIADCLTPHQLQVLLVHELCHVRRRDNLTSAIHMIVEATFWFHPLVWWIGARMVEERERACDEEVLSLGGEPNVYAEAILNVCKLYMESPLACVSGVTGSDLKKRIEAIMTNRIALRLNFGKKAALAVGAMVVLAVPIIVGTMNAPVIRAQSPPVFSPPVNQAPVKLPTGLQIVVQQSAAPRVVAQQTAPPRVEIQPAALPAPAFEVASIKPCGSGSSGGIAKGGGGRSGGGGASGQGPSPDLLNLVCQPVKNLIRMAYVNFADGHRRLPGAVETPVEGGPAWIESERYKVDAKAEGTPGQEMMRGPMLRALLEDRLKVKVRRETREVPAYALTVSKNGPKLSPFQEGTCMVLDFSKPPVPGADLPPFCGLALRRRMASNVEWEVHGATLDQLANALGGDLDRIVINKTGIAGRFDFKLEFAPDETTAGLNSLRVGPAGEPAFPQPADPSGGPSIFTAIQEQLGLKLESAKGPREFLVIDRVEKPTEN
jgi:bla regulator protein BlaR1